MVNKKISELPAATTITGTETVPLVQGGATKAATVTQLLALIVASAPGNLDTFFEVATQFGLDEATVSTLQTLVAGKADAATTLTKPSGGTDGQVLTKSGTSTAWATLASGGGGSGVSVVDNGNGTITLTIGTAASATFAVTDLGNGLASTTPTGGATVTDLGNGLASFTGATVTDLGNGLGSAA